MQSKQSTVHVSYMHSPCIAACVCKTFPLCTELLLSGLDGSGRCCVLVYLILSATDVVTTLFSSPLFVYFVIIETSQATQGGITKYYYKCGTNDTMRDYQRQRRSRKDAFKGISSVTVTARANNLCCILGIYWLFIIIYWKKKDALVLYVTFDQPAMWCCFSCLSWQITFILY